MGEECRSSTSTRAAKAHPAAVPGTITMGEPQPVLGPEVSMRIAPTMAPAAKTMPSQSRRRTLGAAVGRVLLEP